MAIIYRTSDRIELKIGDITVKISPLSLHQKNMIQSLMMEGQKNTDLVKLNKAILMAVSFGLKDIQGVQLPDGSNYNLQFDGDSLSEDCISDLMNMEHSEKLLKVCSSIVAGIPAKFDIEGVSIVGSGKKN